MTDANLNSFELGKIPILLFEPVIAQPRLILSCFHASGLYI